MQFATLPTHHLVTGYLQFDFVSFIPPVCCTICTFVFALWYLLQ